MLIPLTLVLCALPIFCLWQYLKWIEEDRKIGVTGPPCLPIIGNTLELWKHIKNKTAPEKILQLFNKYGDTLRIRIGSKLIILNRDVSITEGIVNNAKFIKSRDYNLLIEGWLGNGLLISSGEHWHKLRKMLTPGFHFQILERFILIFEEHIDILINKLKAIPENQVVNIAPMFHALSLDIISESSMRVKLNAQIDTSSKFVAANQQLLNYIALRFWNQLYRIEWIWKLTSHYRKQRQLIEYVHNFVDEIINKRRDELLSKNHNRLDDETDQKPALIDILLQSELDGKPLSNETIRSEVNTFMFAGHETTGTTLGFLLFCIVKHLGIQKKLVDEIREKQIFDDNEKLTIRKINSLSYLDCVVKETLRLYPILGGAHKQYPEDIRIGNLFLPANTPISSSIYCSHRNPKYFKDPNKFDPDRWSNEVNVKDRNPYAYQLFSSGLRNCIGQKFALLEMKTTIVKILHNFEVHLGSDDFEIDVRAGTLFYSQNGVQVKFTPRKY